MELQADTLSNAAATHALPSFRGSTAGGPTAAAVPGQGLPAQGLPAQGLQA